MKLPVICIKEKSMRKAVIFLLSFILLLNMAACGSADPASETAAPSEELEHHTIGVLVYDRADEEVLSFAKYLREYIGPAFNVEFLYSDSALSEEESQKFIHEAAQYGAEGILSFVTYDLPQEVAACKSEGLYYLIASGTVSDADFAAVEDNDYFLGAVGPGRFVEYKAGCDMAAHFIDKNYGNDYFIFSGGGCLNNEMHLMRTQGILDTLQSRYGVKFDITPEEISLSAIPLELSAGEINVFVYPGYFLTEEEMEEIRSCYEEHPYGNVLSVLPVTRLLDTVGNAKIGVVDCYNETNLTLFTNGTMDYLCGKYSSIIGPSFAAMYNALTGYAGELREHGKAYFATQGFWSSDNEEDYSKKYALANSLELNAYSIEDLQKVIKIFNPEATINDLKALTEASSYAAAMSRRGQ